MIAGMGIRGLRPFRYAPGPAIEGTLEALARYGVGAAATTYLSATESS